MAGLTAEQIGILLSKTRTKGQYVDFMREFLESNEMGVNASETYLGLKDKKATTVSQGFNAVKDKKDAPDGADKVKVVTQEDQVYLLNLAHPDIANAIPEAA